ncbi:glycosyltransferase [bacterium]|nr:glycosyltransferase [bacterium]
MKILFVTDLYPIGEEKIAKALFYFVQEWQKLGHEVDVIRANFITNTLLRGRKITEEKLYEESGTKIYNLNFHTPFFFNVYNKLPKDFSLKNYDVMISHMPCGALMAQKLLKKEKIKYICSVHASDITVLTDFKYLPFRNSLKKAYKLADKISARSPILKEKIEKIIPNNKTFVAYSGIDIEPIEKPLNKELTITTVASLIKRKNIDVIIKALNEMPQIKLNIIGSGPEEKNLKKLANGSNIQFLGQLQKPLVIEQLNKSDIFVLLSDNETFGLSYLEAMATGNIVIGKKGDGIDGILKDNENGFLINPNSEELKKCIDKILSMKEDEISTIKANCAKTIKELTSQSAAENYLKNIQ